MPATTCRLTPPARRALFQLERGSSGERPGNSSWPRAATGSRLPTTMAMPATWLRRWLPLNTPQKVRICTGQRQITCSTSAMPIAISPPPL